MKITTSPQNIQNTSFQSLFRRHTKKGCEISAKSIPKGPVNITELKNLLAGIPAQDIFTPNIIETYMPGPHGSPDIRGKLVKNITLKDSKGKDVPGFIIQEIEDASTYYACTKECALCEMSVVRAHPFGTGYMFINALYGQNNKGDIKGAGTELIKFAIQKSKDEGCDGRIELCMAGSLPFYFKNNFRAGKGYKDHAAMDAFFDYITRQGLNKEQVYTRAESPTLILDEKGAEALLLGIRFSDSSKSETMYSKTIEYKCKEKKYSADVDVDFSDLSDTEPERNTFVIQIILKGNKNFHKQIASLETVLLEDENGEKYFEAKNINIEKMGTAFENAIIEEILKAAELKAKEFGAKYVRTENLNTNRE